MTAAGAAPPSPELGDARWFPVDLHVPGRVYGFLRLDEGVLERSSFLDTRIEAPLAQARPLPADAIDAAGLAQAPLGWLFHTSFCGSTLLARALHLPPYQVALKEPMLLRRLGDARHEGQALGDLVATSVRLLGRPWHADSAVLVKPTHAALNVALPLLDAAPASRALVLTSSLDDFLVSNLKKRSESQARIPELAERALRAGVFHQRLSATALQPPDLLCAAGLQWAAQRELVLDLAETAGAGRVRLLDMQTLLDDVAGTAWACAQWLGLPAPRAALLAQAEAVAGRNAKAVETAYDAQRRAREADIVIGMYADPLARARDWLGEHVLPAMRPAARATPHWEPQ
jgi:hypothetical protein